MKKISCQDAIIYAFDRYAKPALTIDSGTTVEFETFDCFENQVDAHNSLESIDWDRINPATGPVYINGAAEGDVLKVQIVKIEVANQAVMVAGPGLGVMGEHIKEMTQRVMPIENNHMVFNDKLKLPLNKMIGVIGVAPSDEVIPCGVPDTHGGNLDTKLMAEGATLYLPIFVKGALFALGDFHAVMGDGEISVSGAEVGGKATVIIDVIKGRSINHPVLENETHIVFLASKETLDEAVKTATQEAVFYVHKVTQLPIAEVTMLMSAVGNAEISQVVDPLMTARFTVPKYVLRSYGVKSFGAEVDKV